MNELLRRMLEANGYWSPAGADGAEGGSGAPGATGSEGEGDNGGDGGDGDPATGSGDKGTVEGDDKGAGDSDGEGDKTKPVTQKVDDEKAKLIKDTMKWKDTAKTLERQLKEITEAMGDLDPKTARTLADQAKEQERIELERKGEYDRIVQQMRDENKKLLEGKDTQLSDTQKALNEALTQIENLTVGAKFRESEFIADQSTLPPTIAQKEFGDYFEFEDGTMVPYDKPKGAKDRTKLVDADGNPKKFDQAIAELYQQHPDAKSLIRSTVKPGAGSRNQADLNTKAETKSDVRGIGKIQLGLDGLKKT